MKCIFLLVFTSELINTTIAFPKDISQFSIYTVWASLLQARTRNSWAPVSMFYLCTHLFVFVLLSHYIVHSEGHLACKLPLRTAHRITDICCYVGTTLLYRYQQRDDDIQHIVDSGWLLLFRFSKETTWNPITTVYCSRYINNHLKTTI